MERANRCLEREVASRQDHGGENRIRAARFPARKTLEDFDFDHQRSLKRDTLAHLGTLDFVEGTQQCAGATRRYTFQGRLARGPRGFFVSFSPAMSAKATKAAGQKVRAWHLNRRSGTGLSGLAGDINPQVRGWGTPTAEPVAYLTRGLFERTFRRVSDQLNRPSRNSR